MNKELFFLRKQNYGTYNRILARKIGYIAGGLLEELLEKEEFHSKELIDDKKHGNGWFFHTIEAIEERMGLSRYEQETALKKLVNLGVIEVKVFGLPPRRHFRIKSSAILALFEIESIKMVKEKSTNLGESHKLICGFPTNCNAGIPQILPIDDNKEDTKGRERENGAKAPHVFVSFGSHVRLKQEDYEQLCKAKGKKQIDDLIESMNDYCASKGKSYKCYAAAIRQWMRKNVILSGNTGLNKPIQDSIDVEQAEAVRYEFQKFVKKKWDEIRILGIRLEDRVQFAEIGNDKLYYNSPDFPEKSKHCLRKVGLL